MCYLEWMRCLALFTGGLDSQIAVRLMQRQGIEVVGVCIGTPFSRNKYAARQVAEQINLPLHVIDWKDEYFDLLTRPRFGFADQMAPCLDCRIGMVQRARQLMEKLDASFLISGEVIGQRPSSLRSRDLETIAIHGDADDLLLRPLSAKLLPPTLPERTGWVDRERLFGWHGRGRKEQLKLAQEWNLVDPPEHFSAGCDLLKPAYAAKLRKLLAQNPCPGLDELERLKVGRHFWRSPQTHLILSRNEDDGVHLTDDFLSGCSTNAVFLKPANFRGPVGLLTGDIEGTAIDDSIKLILRFSKDVVPNSSRMLLAGWEPNEFLITQAPGPGDSRQLFGFTE